MKFIITEPWKTHGAGTAVENVQSAVLVTNREPQFQRCWFSIHPDGSVKITANGKDIDISPDGTVTVD